MVLSIRDAAQVMQLPQLIVERWAEPEPTSANGHESAIDVHADAKLEMADAPPRCTGASTKRGKRASMAATSRGGTIRVPQHLCPGH